VTRRRALGVFAGLVMGALVPRPEYAAEAVGKVVRVGFVSPFSPSSSPRCEPAFRARLALRLQDGEHGIQHSCRIVCEGISSFFPTRLGAVIR